MSRIRLFGQSIRNENISRPRILWFLVTIVILELLSPLASNSVSLIIALSCVYSIAGIGLNLIFGLGGMISIAQAAVMAVGGYTTVIVSAHSVSLTLAILLGCVFAALCSYLIGLVGTRLKTHYFILASIAIAEVITLAATNATSLTGGSNGIALAATPSVLGIPLGTPVEFMRFGIAVTIIVVYIADALRASRIGVALSVVSVDEYAAAASGVDARAVLGIANIVGGAMGGLAGGLLVALDKYTGPQDYGIDVATILLLIVVVGGRARHGSVVVAAVILTVLSRGLLALQAFGDLIYGLGIVLLIIFAPGGISGLVSWVRERVPSPDRELARSTGGSVGDV